MTIAISTPPPLPKAPAPRREDPRSVQYEILRRNDGMIALSITRGLMGFEPTGMRLIGLDSLEIISADQSRSVQIHKVPVDVLTWVDKHNHIRLYEFAVNREAAGHDVHLVS